MMIGIVALRGVAEDIRPHITPYLEDKGFLEDKDIIALAKKHAAHGIVSERSCRIVDEFLVNLDENWD